MSAGAAPGSPTERGSTALVARALGHLQEAPGDSVLTVGRLEPSRANPVDVFEASLKSPASREALSKSLRRILIATKQDPKRWRTVKWAALDYENTTVIKAALVRDYAPETVKLTLCMLRGVLRTAWRLKQIDGERLMRVIDWGRVTGKAAETGRRVSAADVRKLEIYCSRLPAFQGSMTWALLSLGFGAALRRHELATAPAEGLLVDSDRRVTIRGKGDKVRTVPIHPKVGGAVEDWMAKRERYAEWLDERGQAIVPELFFTIDPHKHERHVPLTDWGVWAVVRDAQRGAGIQRFTPHDMRRTFATALLNKGVPIKHVQVLLGHENPSTTARYDKSDEEAIAKSADRVAELVFGVIP